MAQKLGSKDQLLETLEDAEGKSVIIAFLAPWCTLCYQMKPLFEVLSKRYKDRIVSAIINADELSEIADECKIKAVPTFIVFRNSKEVARLSGKKEEKLKTLFRKHK